MAGRIFTKSSPADLFVVLFINGGTPQKSAPPPIFVGTKRPFFERKFRLCRLRTAATRERGILGKLKQLV